MTEEKFEELTNNIPYWIMRTINDNKNTVKLGYGFMHENVAYGLDVRITISKIDEKGQDIPAHN